MSTLFGGEEWAEENAPSIRKILVDAAKIVNAGWCQGEMATNRKGVPREVRAKDAVCFCATGALWKAACGEGPDLTREEARTLHHANNKLREVIGERIIVDWNDREGQTAAKVVACLHEAARRCVQ